MPIPNPGSIEAVSKECICPVSENDYGNGINVAGEQMFWTNGNCPLHGEARENECD